MRAALILGGVWALIIGGLVALILFTGEQRTSQHADVIIVLGSGLRRDGSAGDALTRRSLWAAQAYADGYAPQIICTGGKSPEQYRSESEACRAILIDSGVPPEAISIEEQSRSTTENALHAGEIMQRMGWQDAVLITDSFHILRASWIFDSEGITHYAYPVPRNWTRLRFYTMALLREIAALHWQALIEVFNLPYTDFNLSAD